MRSRMKTPAPGCAGDGKRELSTRMYGLANGHLARMLQHRRIDLAISAHAGRPVPLAFDELARTCTQPRPRAAIDQQSNDGPRQRVAIPRLEENSRFAMADQLAVPPDVRRNQHPPLCH